MTTTNEKINTVSAKQPQREKIQSQVQEWLSQGNKIEVVPSGSNLPSNAVGIK